MRLDLMLDIFKMFPDLSPSVTALNCEKAMNHRTVRLLCRCFCVQAIDLRTLLPILILLESSSICRQRITKRYSNLITCKYFCMHTIDHNQVQLLQLCESVLKQSITSHISTSLLCSCFSTGTASLLLCMCFEAMDHIPYSYISCVHVLLSAGNGSPPGVATSVGCSVLLQRCADPGNLPHTVHQSPVAISSHHEGPGSQRTSNYCH
jgi:hypothetical protein